MDGGARGEASSEWDEHEALAIHSTKGRGIFVPHRSTAPSVARSSDEVLLLWLDVPSVQEPVSTSRWCRVS